MSSDGAHPLQDVYAAIAELWCSPGDQDGEGLSERRAGAVAGLSRLDEEAAAALARFLEQPVSEEEYVELFELEPRCALYLGSHAFEEPNSCAQAAVSDRNGYMLEVLAVYRHLGLAPNENELPDYLPLLVEFLALTAGSEDPVREKLIQEYILPFLPPMRARLEALKTPYLHLLEALERVLTLDLGAGTGARHG